MRRGSCPVTLFNNRSLLYNLKNNNYVPNDACIDIVLQCCKCVEHNNVHVSNRDVDAYALSSASFPSEWHILIWILPVIVVQYNENIATFLW